MALALTVAALSGCAATVDGTATWPGAVLGQALLTESDFPTGVQYGRIPDHALTSVIKQSAEQSGMLGPGSAAKYAVSYDGARIVMTLLSWNLDLDALNAAADRCAQFEAFFDPASEGIPMTTTALPGLADDALAYQQTMTLGNSSSSVYMAFQNVDRHAVFGVAFPAVNPEIDAKAALPQTFLDVFSNQVNKLQAS
jgi:hypothetical protein